MNGIKFLLDTNLVLGMLKATPGVVEMAAIHHGLELLTLDKALLSVVSSFSS